MISFVFLLIVLLSSTSKSSLVRKSGNPWISSIFDSDKHPGKDSRNGQDKIACKDEKGNFVDWFIVYKLPKIPDAKDEHLQGGSAHYYLLPSSSVWIKSQFAINDSNSLVGRTVEPLNIKNDRDINVKEAISDLSVVLYNDQPPGLDPTIKNGHTKGVILANSLGGLWMPHSVPHFPRVNTSFNYPPGGLDNGQLFLCLSMPLEQLDTAVGGLLQYTKATFYNSSVSPSLQKSLNLLHDIVTKNLTVKQPPWYNSYQLSVGDLDFTVFVKGPKFKREIFADWIAPTYNRNLDVQSWLNGAHPFMSNCTSNCSVYNIIEKQMLGQNFSYANDHSKWAVGSDVSVTCIADLNRMKPQKSRGGVAICTKSNKISAAFKSLIIGIQQCEAKSVRQTRKRKRQHRPLGRQKKN